jgi:transposase
MRRKVHTYKVHVCHCPTCQQETANPIKEQHRLLNIFLSCLNQQQRRWYAAMESQRIGHGGTLQIRQITGMAITTITRGRKELASFLASGKINPVPIPIGGRPRIEKRYPDIKATLERLLADEIAGDPMSRQRWVRSSTYQLTERLKELGYQVGHNTVWRMLKEMGFSLKTNKKKIKFRTDSPERDAQFRYIALQKKAFTDENLPIISVDTKKKESIGNFKNSGRTWCKTAEEVNSYDFTSLAVCRAVPYGIYDLNQNKGYVFVGTSGDTPEFAVAAIARWWRHAGRIIYPAMDKLLILVDGGGSNGCRVRAWKQQLQEKLSDQLGLRVTVCHYPPGCSKWNPVEYRLFSQISINWAGKPLRSLEVMLGYIRGTSTRTGLKVKAFLQKGIYKGGQKVSKAAMDQFNLQPHAVCPDWNYTISPRSS